MANALKDLLAGYRTEIQQAEALDVTVRTLRRWRKMRMGPPFTYKGKVPLYHDEWTTDWLRAGKRQMPRARSRRQAEAEAIA